MKSKSFILFLALCVLSVSSAATIDDVDREFEFASGLIRLGFADFANEVAEEIARQHPDQRNRAQLIKIESLVSLRRLERAEEIAAQLPPDDPAALSARLALANAYYATGNRSRAEEIYKDFFERHAPETLTDPDLRRFYQDAAYRFGQIQEQVGDIEGALLGYENVLKSNPDRNIERRLKSEMADLYLKLARDRRGGERREALERGATLCREVLYGGSDIWFGNAINTLANIRLMEGKREEARNLLTENLDILSQLDKILQDEGLPMDLSPMAGARYILGTIHLEDGRRALDAGNSEEAEDFYRRALTQFVNVFARYSNSRWGRSASEHVDTVTNVLREEFGRTVNIDMGRYRLNAIRARFRRADQYYAEQNYERAAQEYIQALNAYPRTDETGRQLANLGMSFAHIGDDLAVEMLTDYIVERYRNIDNAYRGLLMMGKHYFDKGERDMYLRIYDAFLRHFPNHANAPGVTFTLAMAEERDGHGESSREYLSRLMERYPGSPFYLRATERQGWKLYEEEDFEGAAEYFSRYLEEGIPGAEMARVKSALGDTLVRKGEYNRARVHFSELIEWLSPDDNPYTQSEEDATANRRILERAKYYVGYCLANIEVPDDRLEQVRNIAVTRLREFVENHSESDFAPRALNLVGRVHIELGDGETAAAVYNELASSYPDSAAGQGALYQLIRSASEIGNIEMATEAFDRMLANASEYSISQFTVTGEMMLENGLYENSIRAFEHVLESDTDERRLLERALYGTGRSNYELGNHSLAVEMLNRLMERYPDSAYFYSAKFVLARSHLELGNTNEARNELRDVFEYSQDEVLRREADFQLALVEQAAGNINRALAGFQRIALLTDPEAEETRGILERSMLRSIDLYEELENFEEVVDACNMYLEAFPRGEHVDEVRERRRQAQLR